MALAREKPQQKVAIVGSGMAGLVTAYLLHRDPRQRYAVTIFESGSSFALDSASVSVSNTEKQLIDRVDLPMRAFAEGYYGNLIAMYRYLDVRFRSQPFVYSFEKEDRPAKGHVASWKPYFIHASNNHRIPPLRPAGMDIVSWILEVFYVAWWYFWWSMCCAKIRPVPATQHTDCESLGDYIERVKLPRHFVAFYLLPLISSVSTCTHDELLNFPAKDMLDYKRKSAGRKHYTVAGVYEVQKRLGKGLAARLSANVTSVTEVAGGKLELAWETSGAKHATEEFDRIILAVAPDVVGKIFKPLEKHMQQIPSTTVRSMLQAGGTILSSGKRNGCIDRCPSEEAREAQTIHFHTSIDKGQTESIHMHPSGAKVITCPLGEREQMDDVLCAAQFQRALRTPRSRRIVNSMFREEYASFMAEEKCALWTNGMNNVWLVGGWCWDGMVLLEGCIVSAMRVAQDFDVEIPWNNV